MSNIVILTGAKTGIECQINAKDVSEVSLFKGDFLGNGETLEGTIIITCDHHYLVTEPINEVVELILKQVQNKRVILL